MTSHLDFKFDDNDFVFVDYYDEKESCNESFDYCDDELSELSQSPSSLESVCSETMFEQCSFEVTQDKLSGVDPTALIEADNMEKNDVKNSLVTAINGNNSFLEDLNKKSIETSDGRKIRRAASPKLSLKKSPQVIETSIFLSGSRLSNKKRRKRMKLLKKATARVAALSESQNTNTQNTSPPLITQRKVKSQVGRLTRRPNNLAVACVTESLSTYRKEHNLLNKKIFSH